MATMITGLGGPAGYGENVFSTAGKADGGNDDGAVAVDVTSVFGSGINLFGANYTTLYINSNGAIVFGAADSSFNQTGFDDFGTPALLPFFDDVTITNGGEIYWDIDPANGRIIITWDGVAPFSGSGANSFQVVLTDLGSGDMQVEYIYEDIQWSGTAGSVATTGLTDGNGTDFSLEFSENASGLLSYETNDFNGGDPAGTFSFEVIGGMPSALAVTTGSGNDALDLGFVDALGNTISTDSDVIYSGDGNDIVDGDTGDDSIYGGAGDDILRSGSDGGGVGGSINWTTVNSGANLQGTTGQDFFQYNGGSGSSATVRLNNSAPADVADSVADYIHVTSTADNVFLQVGDFQSGVDKIVLSDTYTILSSSITGSQVDVTVRLTNGNDQSFRVFVDGAIVISDFFTTTLPSPPPVTDDDLLDGGDGADTFLIEDQFGNDTVVGGEGGTDSDTIDLAGLSTAATVSLSGAEAGTVTSGGDAISFSEIERIRLTDQNDTFTGGGALSGTTIEAGAGDDSVLGTEATDSLMGGDGNDTIDARSGNDFLYGGAGNDSLTGNGGDQVFFGDRILVDPTDYPSVGAVAVDFTITNSADAPIELWWIDWSGVTIFYTDILPGQSYLQPSFEGHMWILRDSDGNTLQLFETVPGLTVNYGATGLNDTIVGGESSDLIYGEFGDDQLEGGLGADSLYGGSGSDTLIGGDGDDFLKSGQGNDQLFGGDGADTLMNSAGDDTLVGGSGDDTLIATAGNDTLFGGAGNDTAMGGTDNDSIDGGADNDLILGDLAGVVFNATNTDGVGQVANMTDFPTSQLTYEITFASTDTTGNTAIASYATATQDNTFTLQLAGGNLAIYVNGAFSDTGIPAATIFDGNINTLAVTWDGSTGAYEVFLNGASLHTGTVATGQTIDQGGTFVLAQDQDTLGGGFDAPQAFEGTIYGVSLYDDIRTPSEVLDSVEGAYADTADPNLIANWVADAQGASFTDTTGSHAMVMSGDVAATWTDGADTITGGTGDDTIYGGGGADTIDGGAGRDTIYGNTGDDTISGGDGDDVFVFSAGDGADTITDFNFGNTGALGDGNNTNNDFIDLSAFYDNLTELRDDFDDDGILNQSNDGVGGVSYADNTRFEAFDGLTFQGANRNSFSDDNTGVVCFTAGTRILTPVGERLIEDLRKGDMVVTRDNGPQRLLWVGRRHLGKSALMANARFLPVLLKPDLTGASAPLIVSQQHGVLLRQDQDEVLIRAKHLAGMEGGLARLLCGCRSVTYYHLLFEDHQIVYANGAPSESFYPGPQALHALHRAARDEVLDLFPTLGAQVDTALGYGAKARAFQPRRALPQKLRALQSV